MCLYGRVCVCVRVCVCPSRNLRRVHLSLVLQTTQPLFTKDVHVLKPAPNLFTNKGTLANFNAHSGFTTVDVTITVTGI